MEFEFHTKGLHEVFANPDQAKVFSLNSHDIFVHISLPDLCVLLLFVM